MPTWKESIADRAQMKRDLCAHFKLKSTELSVSYYHGVGGTKIKTKSVKADGLAQEMYDYLREHKDKYDLYERVDDGSDMPQSVYNITLNVTMYNSTGGWHNLTYPQYVPPPRPPVPELPDDLKELLNRHRELIYFRSDPETLRRVAVSLGLLKKEPEDKLNWRKAGF